MARTPSAMVALDTSAPDFELMDTDGKTVRFSDTARNRAALVMFICNHCPFVKHVRAELAAIGREYLAKGVAVFAINSNDAVNYPEDSPEKMKVEKREQGYLFPYLYDETQAVAKAYHATCTPDFFLFDAQHKLFYRGQLDDSRPGNGVAVDGRDLRAALERVLKKQPVPELQLPSMGCNIKWKSN